MLQNFTNLLLILEVKMKFSHTYEIALKHEGYSDHWVKSAISYRQLKKCIKKVRDELSSIGLDVDTLKSLWQSLESTTSVARMPWQYTFEGSKPYLIQTMVFADLKQEA